ncbi:MAG TPA: hypothetical protein VEP30_00940 [Chthoniobacterales bacterium]|nr:hypothetical protein [Chthoniobacterales bacterium]
MKQSRALRNKLASRHLNDGARGKEKEFAIVSGFLNRLQLNPDELIAGERPDFVVSFAGGALVVGLELTLLNADAPRSRGSPERSLHSAWKEIARLLRDRLLREPEPLPNVYGSVFFRTASASVLYDIDRDQFSEEIVIMLRRTPLSKAGSQITAFDPMIAPLLARAVEHLYVRLLPSESGLLWWCADLQSGQVADSSDAIKATIAEKQEKARGYQWGRSQERWLLIYAAGEGLSDLASAPEDPGIEKSDPFTHIFLWDKFSETIHCLSPTFATVVREGETIYHQHLPAIVREYVKDSSMMDIHG